MPDLSFDLNLGSLLSPVFLLALAFLGRQVQKGAIAHFDKRHDEVEGQVAARHTETTEHLKKIEEQTTLTNGRVKTLEESTKSDHDMLLTLKGSVDTLMGLRKGEP